MKYRRFGKTEIQVPVITCGGMRFQESWTDSDPVSKAGQKNLEACVHRAFELGINHFETARGYGTSEFQLGKILPQLPRDEITVQTKVAPHEDPRKFVATFEKSMGLLQLDYVDLFAFHGVNSAGLLEQTLACFEHAERWKKEGRVRHIGFSSHGPKEILLKSVQTDMFEYMNHHWFYIFQDNWPAVLEATKRDMGVFIISPNDKGGMLFNATEKLMQLTEPLHPIVFNDLFCLSRPEVHTISCGVARPEDFALHVEAVELLDRADELVPPIEKRLDEERKTVLGKEWLDTWQVGLPDWEATPGHINIPVILHLRNLALAFDMVEYGKMRYNLLGCGDHWFPGNRADKLDSVDLSECLKNSPHASRIPSFLAEAHTMLAGKERKRLQEGD